MEDFEILLREEIQQPAEYTRESVNVLIADTRRLRSRRTLLATTSAAGSVAAVIALVLVLTSSSGTARQNPATGRQTPTATRLAGLGGQVVPLGGEFVDAQRGFVVAYQCAPPKANRPSCLASLQVTTDGGRTFAKRALPDPYAVVQFDARLYAFDADHLVFDRPALTFYYSSADPAAPSDWPSNEPGDRPSNGPGEYPSGWPGPSASTADYPGDLPGYFPSGPSDYPSQYPSDYPTDFPPYYPTEGPSDYPSDYPSVFPSDIPALPAARWVSSDAGATWRSVSTETGQPVAEIPSGARLITTGDRQHGQDPRVAALGPDGVAHPLTGAPPGGGTPFLRTPSGLADGADVGGSYFINVLNTTFDGSNLAGWMVSIDRGRTWQRPTMPKDRSFYMLVGADAGTLYAFSYGDFNRPGPPQARLIKSEDGGLNWASVQLPAAPERILPSVQVNTSDSANPGDPAENVVPYLGISTAIAPDGGLLWCDWAQLSVLDRGASAFSRIGTDDVTYQLIGMRGGLLAIRRAGPNSAELQVSRDGRNWHPAAFG